MKHWNHTHGHTVKRDGRWQSSRTYESWSRMKQRCFNPNDPDYDRYGGRGITVHPEWIDNFESFLAHVGVRPEGKSLDRIEGDKNYVPGNVRWATPKEQANNRRHVPVDEKRSAAATKLTSSDAAFIRHWIARGYGRKPIAGAFGVSTSMISRIHHRKSW